MLVVAILGTLAALTLPSMQAMIDRARVAKAIGDIEAIEVELATFEADADSLPTTLAGIGRAGYLDPWGHPYRYLKFPRAGGTKHGASPPAGARKDRFLVPINSTYDLYSMGKDGVTQAPLTAAVSRDDVVRANDGSFVGLAARY